MEEADRLTTLLPIRMALSIFPWLAESFSTHWADLLPDSARFRMRILFTVVKAVSEDEKKADNPNKIRITIKRMVIVSPDRSKHITPVSYI